MAALLLPRPPGRWRWPPLLSLLAVVPALFVATHLLHAHLSGEGLGMEGIASGHAKLGRGAPTLLWQLFSHGPPSLLLPFVFEAGELPNIAALLVTGLALLLVTLALARGSPSVRRQLLAFLLAAFASYAVVAVGRGSFYHYYGRVGGSVARYHYGAFIALTLVLCAALKALADGWRVRSGLRSEALLTCLTLLAVAWTTSPHRIDHHEKDARIVTNALAVLRSQIAQCEGCQSVDVENRYLRGLLPVHPPALFPGWAALFVIFHPDNSVDGKKVRFREKDPRVVDAARRGRRTRDLLVFQ
jgi:hypothetical protein